MDYRAYFETVIARRDYLLADMESRINKIWIEGKLTDADRDALLQMAAENAKDVLQVNVVEKLAELEHRVWQLEFPVDQFPIWQQGQVSERGVVYRYDVTGDGEYDLCRYDGGRASTALSIGKIEGWHMLDRELNVIATITRDADGGYVITNIEIPEDTPAEPEPETTE